MAVIDGQQIVLTGDVDPEGLHEAAQYAEILFGRLRPEFIQVPHHGSRRNVTPSALNRWLGPIQPQGALPVGVAYCSAARLDEEHPRKKVVNAFTRRGYEVYATNGQHIFYQLGTGRTGSPITPQPFSAQVEE